MFECKMTFDFTFQSKWDQVHGKSFSFAISNYDLQTLIANPLNKIYVAAYYMETNPYFRRIKKN